MTEPDDTPLRRSPTRAGVPARAKGAAVHWHDAECGAYTADLSLWEELAAHAGDPVLEVGCGSGRVALHLAGKGHEVWGIDRGRELLVACEQRATAQGVTVRTVLADATEFELPARFALILAPMQIAQTLEGEGERSALLSNVASHLGANGIAALALLDEQLPPGGEPTAAAPDTREVDGWTYSSQPIEVRLDDDALVARRLRQVITPAGDLHEESVHEDRFVLLEPERLEREARQFGLRPAGRRGVPATAEHAGSLVVLLERGRR